MAYNAPRSLADLEKIWFFRTFPDYVHPDFAPKDFQTLAEEASRIKDHTLGEAKWEESRVQREINGLDFHQIFNFQRLVSYLIEVRDEYQTGAINQECILAKAIRRKIAPLIAHLNSYTSI